MTWAEIIKIEPALESLYDEAKAVRDEGSGDSFCANLIWYEQFKPRLVRLAGWDARKSELRSTEAYDLAYRKIYDPIPACRGCGCL